MEFTVVGAGMAGSFLALSLGRQGHSVTVYDLRPDPRASYGDGSSMNLGLSRRGLDALAGAGLRDEVDALVMPMRGRLMHGQDGSTRFSAYGRGGILAIQRRDLGALLVDAAAKVPGVRFVFETRCTGIEKDDGIAYFVDESTGRSHTAKSDVIVGADGAFSAVRRFMQHDERADYRQEFLDWGWRELHISATAGGAFLMDPGVFHLWPRGETMMFAHPNRDGSFTCSVVLPFHGPRSFANLRGPADVRELFGELFPDLLTLAPELERSFFDRPTMNLMSTRTSRWYHGGRVVLIGDACHAVFPFLAQGMNAAFEDCIELSACLAADPNDPEAAFARYYARRKPNTDALADMSRQNFAELRDTVRSPAVRVEKVVDMSLERVLRRRWMPLHAMVTNTTIPYAQARRRAARQHRVLRIIAAVLGGLGIGGLVRYLRP